MAETAAAVQTDVTEIGNTRLFITFAVGDELFAVGMDRVQEIIRMPALTRVPLSHAAILGVSNLRGRVLPVANLRRLSGLADSDADDATRVIVLKHRTPVGFVVDNVKRALSVSEDRLESADTIESTFRNEFLAGMIKGGDNEKVVQVLNLDQIMDTEFAEMAQAAGRDEALGGGAATSAESARTVEVIHLISFSVAQQDYALPIAQVKEIVQVPENVSRMPNTDAHVLGMMTLRDRLLPLVSLRRMFGIDEVELSDTHRVVVVPLDGKRGRDSSAAVGIVMDAVNEVLRVPRTEVDDVPELLAGSGKADEVGAICRLDGGRRLVSVLALENLFRNDALRQAAQSAEELAEEKDMQDTDESISGALADDDEQVVVFRLDREEYGLPIGSVKEIVRVPDELTRVPKAPDFVEGVLNLRGAVLPVVDQRRRFGLSEAEQSEQRRIIVLQVNGGRTGFIVDAVSEVRRLPNGEIEQAPQLSAEQARVITRVANLESEKRMILLLDAEKLLADEELNALSAIEADEVPTEA